jgi:GH18 family chitinase
MTIAMIVLLGFPITVVAQPPSKPLRIAGYLPDYRFSAFDPVMAQGLTDLIVFSAELNEDGTADTSRLSNCPWPALQKLRKESKTRLWIAIGGWDRSGHFAAVASSAEKRRRCVDSISKIVSELDLAGVDLDWEHPKDAKEEKAYGTLLRDLRAALEPKGRKLSVTIAGWQKLNQEAIDSVDYVQIMAYDQGGRHSTFEGSVKDVETQLKSGVPASKITLGVPFYGRNINSRDAMTYGEIVSRFDPAPKVDESGGIYFNGTATLRKKVNYAHDHGLSGIMIWEIGQDASGQKSLLKSIREEATKLSR